MRKPAEYLTAAFAKLRSGALSEFSETLRLGEKSATVTRIGTARNGDDEVTDGGVPEFCRVLAYAADLPEIKSGDAVEFGDSMRVVTSCSSGPAYALKTIGLSAAFEKIPATYAGTRRENNAVRSFSHPLCVLLLENGHADTHTDAFAPTYAAAYLVGIRRDDWPELTDPGVADTLTISPDGVPFVVKVSAVTRHDGWYVLNCRARS